MAIYIGIVVSNEENGLARVVTDRQGACGGCRPGSGGCRGCLSSAKLESLVANPIGARKGDVVKITLASADLFKGAALLYLLPPAALLAGAMAAAAAAPAMGWPETASGVAGAAAGLLVGFILTKWVDGSRWTRRRLTPRITAVVEAAGSTSPFAPLSCCH